MRKGEISSHRQRTLASKGMIMVIICVLSRLARDKKKESISYTDAGDVIDALALELVGLIDETGQVLGAAGRREGTGHAHQDNFLA